MIWPYLGFGVIFDCFPREMQVGSSFSGLVNTVPGQESHWVAILVIKLFDRPQPRPTQDGHLQDGHGERPALQRRVWCRETAGRREARDGGGQEAGESHSIYLVLFGNTFNWSFFHASPYSIPLIWSSFGNTFNWSYFEYIFNWSFFHSSPLSHSIYLVLFWDHIFWEYIQLVLFPSIPLPH